MEKNSHYFNQLSIDQSQYFSIRGIIDKANFSLMSAKGLFSASGFDLGTRILLKYFRFDYKGNISLLDLGCGYGLISSFLLSQYTQKKIPDISNIHFDACDSSSLAVDLTNFNLQSYQEQKNITYKVINSDILSDGYFLDKKYNIIITNPPFSAGKKIVQGFIKQGYDHLQEGGILWIVVPTNKGAKSYVKYTQEIFGLEKVKIVALEAGYRVWIATK